MNDTTTQETSENNEQVFGEDVFDQLVAGTPYDYEAQAKERMETPATSASALAGSALVQPSSKMPKFDKAPGTDMAPVKAYEITAAGIKARPATQQEARKLEKQEAVERGEVSADGKSDEELSPALAFLREIEGENADTPDSESYDMAGKKVFIARLSGAEIQQFSALCARNSKGELDLASSDEVTSLVRATLFLCVRKNPEGAKFFDLGSAWAYANNRKASVVPIVAALFDKCCAVNPLLISDPETVSKAIQHEKKERREQKSKAAGKS